jgi:hypothetical protein
MVTARPARRSAVLVVCLAAVSLPACGREQRFVRDSLAALPGVGQVDTVSCGDNEQSPDNGVCATVAMTDGAVLRFAELGFGSFGPVPSRVRVVEAGGRVPLVVSCDARVTVADVDRTGLFGHHFTPALDGVRDAIQRYREVVEELEFWPQCPQFWELQGEAATRYRYCAHAAGRGAEAPPAACR